MEVYLTYFYRKHHRSSSDNESHFRVYLIIGAILWVLFFLSGASFQKSRIRI